MRPSERYYINHSQKTIRDAQQTGKLTEWDSAIETYAVMKPDEAIWEIFNGVKCAMPGSIFEEHAVRTLASHLDRRIAREDLPSTVLLETHMALAAPLGSRLYELVAEKREGHYFDLVRRDQPMAQVVACASVAMGAAPGKAGGALHISWGDDLRNMDKLLSQPRIKAAR